MLWPPNENKIKFIIEIFFTAEQHETIVCSSDTTTGASEGEKLSEGQSSFYLFMYYLLASQQDQELKLRMNRRFL